MARKAKSAARPAKRKASAKRAVPARRKAFVGEQATVVAATAAPATRVRIRMYRLGVGDCFLLAFPRDGQEDFRILIDCGVHQAQEKGNERLKQVVDDLHLVTKGKIDVVIGTHEHQDHLSGFPALLEKFTDMPAAGEIWVAWTENENDPLANDLRGTKDRALTTLSGARMRMKLAGATGEEEKLSSVLGFFGDGSGPRLRKFGAALKQLSSTIKYREPGEDPIELLDGQARVFVLGPPRDARLIGQSAPSKSGDQVYSDTALKFGAYTELLDEIAPAFDREPMAPFDDRFALSLEGTKALPFFKQRYWADTNDENLQERTDTTQDWRRIDNDWLGSATTLALKLNEDTNNTSLVLAFELGPKDKDGPVLLFAADAQVGNWLSWQNLEWNYGGRRITGPDLIKRTVLYKVGHHASHNATLKKLGLEMMAALELALVPTDAEMARRVKWGTLPWPPLLEALADKAKHGVVRTDETFVAKTPDSGKPSSIKVTQEELYYEVEYELKV